MEEDLKKNENVRWPYFFKPELQPQKNGGRPQKNRNWKTTSTTKNGRRPKKNGRRHLSRKNTKEENMVMNPPI